MLWRMPDRETASPTLARPLRSDAARNRRALVQAAREIFERDGFVSARITDIADRAGVAHGSFYSHFPDKRAAFAAVLDEVQEEMLQPGAAPTTDLSDPAEVIERANRAYLEAYQRNARLMVLLEQVATVDEDFLQLRMKRTDAFVRRNAKAIRRLQRAGQADPELDPSLASLAISAMVSRTAYATLGVGDRPVNLDRLVATLNRLWTNALRITPDAAS
jgi:AcrR family transcriptional regulator